MISVVFYNDCKVNLKGHIKKAKKPAPVLYGYLEKQLRISITYYKDGLFLKQK